LMILKCPIIKKSMKYFLLSYIVVAAMLTGCVDQRRNPADLQHKIDSVIALDNAERLRLQGIKLEDDNPMKAFFDSLALQPLPVVCTEEYMMTLPRFVNIPDYLTGVLEIKGGLNPLAISLPESLGARLMMVAIDNRDGDYSLWLYSLDDYYLPVDKLLLYSPSVPTATGAQQISDCIISRDYEIVIREYDNATRKIIQKVYHVGEGRTFLQQK
jgi:hypothetical protein